MFYNFWQLYFHHKTYRLIKNAKYAFFELWTLNNFFCTCGIVRVFWHFNYINDLYNQTKTQLYANWCNRTICLFFWDGVALDSFTTNSRIGSTKSSNLLINRRYQRLKIEFVSSANMDYYYFFLWTLIIPRTVNFLYQKHKKNIIGYLIEITLRHSKLTRRAFFFLSEYTFCFLYYLSTSPI